MYKSVCGLQFLTDLGVWYAFPHYWLYFIDHLSNEMHVTHTVTVCTKGLLLAHLKANVLSFFVAIQPQDQVVHSLPL